ncbi:septum formation family protein, partial [Frankia nepalensis]
SWTPTEETTPARRKRRVISTAVILIFALVAGYLVVGLPFPWSGGNGADDGPAASGRPPAGDPSPGPEGTTGPDLWRHDYRRGDCYRWDQDAAQTSVRTVPCAEPHLFQSVSGDAVDIGSEYRLGAPYPDYQTWIALEERYCVDPVERFLGHPLDPYGRFYLSAVHPSLDGWQRGERDVHCGLSGRTPYAATPGRHDLFTGSAEGADQAWVFPAGTCLASDADGVVGVACAEPHQQVAIGGARLADTRHGAAPSEQEFKAQAQPLCAAVARDYLGPSFQQTETVRVGWLPIAEESWRAGSRAFTCAITYVTPSGDLRFVTGDLLHPEEGVLA